ncbi:hypothetical protein EGW08_014159 [Elysia chlorotica]|uniref:Uncharacterized protein n=1 Tax=Elysia chlorotica TaxID=188477 RepID=A0A433T907_ELYCH|nr:hypothetical protein EGW08_014159 [Elysia chlorotica]
MSRLLSLCTAADTQPELVTNILSLLEGMVRVSCVMNRLLIKQGVLESLSYLLRNCKSSVADKVLGILEVLLQDLDLPHQAPDVMSNARESLQYLTTVTLDSKMIERAKAVMELVPK